MEWLRKLTDWIIPRTDEDEELENEEVKKVEAPSKTVEKTPEPSTSSGASTTAATGGEGIDNVVSAPHTAGGNTVSYGNAMKFNGDSIVPPPPIRPSLTVIDSKIKELNVKIYNPTKYEEASQIAADILNRNAAVVNYDYVEASLQLRICDFLNGVCYVTDGYTDKISEKIFLYVPEGVDTVDIAEAVAAVNNNRRGMFAN